MSYTMMSRMKESRGLIDRIVACAAQENATETGGVSLLSGPENWVQQNLWAIISNTDWVTAWQYAEDTKTANVNPDTGARDDVINDGMILAAVQALKTELSAP